MKRFIAELTRNGKNYKFYYQPNNGGARTEVKSCTNNKEVNEKKKLLFRKGMKRKENNR